jgi:hypothetical protein
MVLMVCVWARDMVLNASRFDVDVEELILAALIALDGYDFLVKEAFTCVWNSLKIRRTSDLFFMMYIHANRLKSSMKLM